MVLLCHEINDIFLEAAKMTRYMRCEDTFGSPLFVAFALSWFVTRLYMFPAYVIRSTLLEAAVRFLCFGVRKTVSMDGIAAHK